MSLFYRYREEKLLSFLFFSFKKESCALPLKEKKSIECHPAHKNKKLWFQNKITSLEDFCIRLIYRVTTVLIKCAESH